MQGKAQQRARRGQGALVVWVLALLLAAIGGCDGGFAGGVSEVTPLFAKISQQDLRELDGDAALAIELDGPYPTVFEFDGVRAPIDFSRVEISAPGHEPLPMDLWLARQAVTFGVDLATLPTRRFRLSNDATAAALGLDAAGVMFRARACEDAELVELDGLVAVVFHEGDCP